MLHSPGSREWDCIGVSQNSFDARELDRSRKSSPKRSSADLWGPIVRWTVSSEQVAVYSAGNGIPSGVVRFCHIAWVVALTFFAAVWLVAHKVVDQLVTWLVLVVPVLLGVIVIAVPARHDDEQKHMRWRYALGPPDYLWRASVLSHKFA